MGGKDGSLNVDIKPEQAKALCDEFKSASKKCRTHAVVGKMLGGNCGGAGKDGKDFCDGAPTHLVNLCKAEKLKCKTTSKEEAKQKACWEKKMKELKDMANRGSGSGAKKPQGSGSGSTGGSGSSICSIALNAMRDMMKGIDMKKEITKERLKGLCLGYSSMGQMAAQLANCKNDELKKGLANAKKLCPPKQTGSGSGAKKPMTTKKADASQMCAEALKKLSGFRTIQDVKKVSVFKKAALCSVYSQVSTIKRAALKQMCSKSTELKQALAVADALCGAKKPMATKKPGSTGSGSGYVTRIVQKKRVVATQGISIDLTLPTYYKVKADYEVAFLTASGARKADSTVKYTRVAPKSGGRRLAEGTSVATWVLGFDNDYQATAAQAKVSSAKFTEHVAKAAGVKVEAAKATVKVFEVKVTEKVVGSGSGKGKPGAGSGSGGKGKPGAGSGSGGKGKPGAGGLRIRSPNACIELGSDVKIKRVGDGKLGFDANVHVNGAVDVKKLYIDGMSIEDIVRKLVAEALKNK